MKHVILAEPATLGLFGLGFMLLLMALVVVGVIGIVALVLGRKEKTAEPPVIPPAPSTAPIPQKCPKCGVPMPSDSPEGLCPRCLIALNLATQTDIPGEVPIAKTPPGPPLPVGDIAKLFPQLEILECLGRGGMGAVYKARQPRLDRIVALKILSPEKQGNQKFAERFEREARALAKLHHPNIVTVYDFGETQGNFYLLMEFVDGLTLRQLLQSRKLAPEEALAIVPKICEALQYAHGQGIVHRDIKPENVLMDKEGRVKIADFGIAKILGDGERTNLTEEQAIGTPHYMSPEQIERPHAVDHRADIYSLGVVFYEMLTGELPLGKFQPPSKKVQVDVRLDEIVLRALEKEPERRYQQASEVKTRVENIAATPSSAGTSGQSNKKSDHFWRWFAVICLSLIVIPILIFIAGILLAMFVPPFMKARERAQAIHQKEIMMQQAHPGTASPILMGNSGLENANTNHPKVIWVSPADGTVDADTQQDIHIRFDQPMNPNDIVINWQSGGFLANGEPHYDAGKNEFIVPVQLLADRTNIVQVNWVSGGFRSTNGIPADEYKWQFTTKALATNPDAPKPKVVDVSPGGGETLPVLTMLELTFDQPMTLDRGLPYLRGTGSAFVPAMISDFHYDAAGRRLTIPLILPPDNETKLTLEGLYSADGAACDPVVIRCEIGTNNYSSQQLADISAAAQDPRLEQLLSAMQTARTRLASGTETVTGTSVSPMQDSLRRFTVYPATFRWQGTNEYYEDISDIMECKAFILGTDGKNCWIYSDDQYSGRRFDSSPRAAMADFFANVADPFNLARNSVQAAIAKGKLMYDGQAQLDGHNCYCVKCCLVEQTGNDYFPVDASRREWWIDAETYLPVQVAVDGGEKEIYQFHYTGLNQPLPITAFQPPGTQGALPLDWYQLSPKETRFFTIKDGSDGQMSGRIGKRGPNGGSTSCGLN